MMAAAKTAVSSATTNIIFGAGCSRDDAVAVMFYPLLHQAVYSACYNDYIQNENNARAHLTR
jgi:hypothetical protein